MAGVRSLLAFWIGGAGSTGSAPAEVGFRSLLAPWIGGAGQPVNPRGVRGLLAFWMGGASGGTAPAPEVHLPAGHHTAIEKDGRIFYFENDDLARQWLESFIPHQAKVVRKLARKVVESQESLLSIPRFNAPRVLVGEESLVAFARTRAQTLQREFIEAVNKGNDDEAIAALLVLLNG